MALAMVVFSDPADVRAHVKDFFGRVSRAFDPRMMAASIPRPSMSLLLSKRTGLGGAGQPPVSVLFNTIPDLESMITKRFCTPAQFR